MSPQFAWFLECRETPRVIHGDGRQAVHAEDYGDEYRQFEFLNPLVLLPDYRLGFSEDTEIGVHRRTVFRRRLLCTFSAPTDFDDFVEQFPDVVEPRPRQVRRRTAYLMARPQRAQVKTQVARPLQALAAKMPHPCPMVAGRSFGR